MKSHRSGVKDEESEIKNIISKVRNQWPVVKGEESDVSFDPKVK